jgi:cytochrome bd-type quinol oxidase subunit 2
MRDAVVRGLALRITPLGYTAWSYWVFRGKVRSELGYY